MSNTEKAAMLHKKGYNCCQAVVGTFADRLDCDEKTLFMASEGLGLGMGGMSGTCGALSGAIMVAGLMNSDGNLEGSATKASSYKLSKEIFNRFNEKCGTTVCKELKGVETGNILRTCSECITAAVECVDEILNI